jgi:hypothetical protein
MHPMTLEARLNAAVDKWFDANKETCVTPGIPGAKDSYMMQELKDALKHELDISERVHLDRTVPKPRHLEFDTQANTLVLSREGFGFRL